MDRGKEIAIPPHVLCERKTRKTNRNFSPEIPIPALPTKGWEARAERGDLPPSTVLFPAPSWSSSAGVCRTLLKYHQKYPHKSPRRGRGSLKMGLFQLKCIKSGWRERKYYHCSDKGLFRPIPTCTIHYWLQFKVCWAERGWAAPDLMWDCAHLSLTLKLYLWARSAADSALEEVFYPEYESRNC